MTSKIWVEGCKYSAIVGTIFGLLLPGLPLLAAPSASGENFSSTSSGSLLIAQTTSLCVKGHREHKHFSTASYEISICQDESRDWYLTYADSNNANNYEFVSGVSTNDDGTYYAAAKVTDDGTTFVYSVGDYFEIRQNDKVILIEETL
ncbi:hypothetical protein [Microcoleus sp. MON2_D5]|uniref:hypothetical protein n=1 Tax=Microcoleus sp. MON2_D5 TaxID=2818833 RepID=UPI002FD133FB